MLNILKSLMATVRKNRKVVKPETTKKTSRDTEQARQDAKKWLDILHNVTVYDGTGKGQRKIG